MRACMGGGGVRERDRESVLWVHVCMGCLWFVHVDTRGYLWVSFFTSLYLFPPPIVSLNTDLAVWANLAGQEVPGIHPSTGVPSACCQAWLIPWGALYLELRSLCLLSQQFIY